MKKHFLLLVLLCGSLTTLFSQKPISGTVLNDKGEPLVGANIVLKGTTMGVITDIDGHYEINIPSKHFADTLICSFVGYESEFLKSNSLGKLDFKLTEGLLMQTVNITAFFPKRCCCFCCGTLVSIAIYEDWKNPLTPIPLSNGATLLNYEVDISSKNYNQNLTNRFKEKKVQYQIFKSTDGEKLQTHWHISFRFYSLF